MLQQAHSNQHIGGKSTPGSLNTPEKTQIILPKNYCETLIATKNRSGRCLPNVTDGHHRPDVHKLTAQAVMPQEHIRKNVQ